MCEAMGSEPIEDEIPPDIEDFPVEVGIALSVYNLLPIKIDRITGTYEGKSIDNFSEFVNILGIEGDKLELLRIVLLFDKYETESINIKKQQAANNMKG